MTRRELSEIQQRVTQMLKEFEDSELITAEQMMQERSDDLQPEDFIKAEGAISEGRPREARMTLLHAVKRRTSAAMGELQHGNEKQMGALGVLDTWFSLNGDEDDEVIAALLAAPKNGDVDFASSRYLEELPQALSAKGQALAAAHRATMAQWQQRWRARSPRRGGGCAS